MRNGKNPSSIVYWNDIDKDELVNACSIAAQGLWWKMLAHAARSPEPGVVIVGNHPSPVQELPRLFFRIIAETIEVTAALVDELVTVGVGSVDDQGRFYNRRMVRDEQARKAISAARAQAGKKGGKARAAAQAKGKQKGSKTPSKAQAKDKQTKNGLTHGDVTINHHYGEPFPKQTASKPPSKTKHSSLLHSSKEELRGAPMGGPPREDSTTTESNCRGRAGPSGAPRHVPKLKRMKTDADD